MSRSPKRSALATYLGRVREFDRTDWFVYLTWVGMMLGLCVATAGLLFVGTRAGVSFPSEAWMVPAGAAIFATAIAIDTIGHRTIYKEVLRGGEQLVHHITIVCGVGSCVLLCVGYSHRGVWVPALVLTVMSFVYSLVDEVFHWRRYTSGNSEPVEMWSHLGIFVGHGTMMLGWWLYFADGYQGIRETLAIVGAR